MDRRVIRTRRLLGDALLALITETGDYDSITVDALTTRAELRRATFYLHYKSMDEVLLDALQTRFDQLAAQSAPNAERDAIGGKTGIEAFRITFQHAADHRALYRILFASKSAAAINRRVRDTIVGLVMAGLQKLPPGSLPLAPEIIAQSIAAAETGLLGWWLETDAPYTADQMAESAHRLINDGIRALLPDVRLPPPDGG